MAKKYQISSTIAQPLTLAIILCVLASCGGGGGGGTVSAGGSSGISYDGLTTQATLTNANAQKFFSITWGNGSSSKVSSVQSSDSKKVTYGPLKNRSLANILERLKNRSVSDYTAYAVKVSKTITKSAVPVNQTRSGSISGTLTISGNLDSNSGTGTLTVSYVNFNDGDGITYDGTMTLTVNGYDKINDLITDGTESFTSWNIKSGSSNYSLSGTNRLQENTQNNTSTRTYNVVGLDNISNEKFRFENIIDIITYDNILNPTFKSETCTGRVYVDKFGYVNVSVSSPLVYSTISQVNPDSGGPILLGGAGNSKAILTPYSTSYATINVDADGDGTYESGHVYSWSNLTGSPIAVTPVASAGSDQTVVATTLVTLDGTGSVDLNGSSLTYAWTITSKPNGSSAVLLNASSTAPSFTADVRGTYVISLVVNNGSYSSNPDTVTILATFNVTQPSPTPPLSQSVAYQMDYAHSGRVVFADPVSFPGSTAWSATLNGAISYPLIAGGRVFVTTSNPGGAGNGSSLYALNKQTGNVIWGPIYISGYRPRSGLAYDNGKVFIIDPDGLLKAFNAATGTLLWSSQMPWQYSFSSPPTAINGIVYVAGAGSGGTLYAVDAANGDVLWTAGVANGDQSSPAVSSDGVFVTYPEQAYKFDPLTGASLWHYSGGGSGGGGRTAAYANGRLYMRDWTNSLGLIFNAQTGSVVGNFTATPIPAFSVSTGFFLDPAGTVKGIDLNTNAVLWSFTGDGNLVSAPIVINDVVVIGSSSGNVYAVNANTGLQIWRGNTGSAISAPDEQNVSAPLTGLGAGEGYLVVPAGNVLTAWHISGP